MKHSDSNIEDIIKSINHPSIPKEFLRFAKVILYCRFKCLIMGDDFDIVIKDTYKLVEE